MPRRLLMLLAVLLVCAVAYGQQKTYNYNNLSPADIRELQDAQHAFYRAEAAGYQNQIREILADRKLPIDGNQADFDVRYYGLNIKLDFVTSTSRDMSTIRFALASPHWLPSTSIFTISSLLIPCASPVLPQHSPT